MILERKFKMATMFMESPKIQVECPQLTVLIENVQALSDEDYALARRAGLGASDASVLLDVNPYKTKDQLIIEKRSRHITDEERAIKDKDAVRKGFDLEPLILQKFHTLSNKGLPFKPQAMYQITNTPYLTINFDGIIEENNKLIPVEAKFVTTYGDKYYNRKNAILRERGDCHIHKCTSVLHKLTDRIKARAEAVGIPPYYYVQTQHQMYGLDAPYAYLVALHDKGWECVVYFIPRDEECISEIKIQGLKTWQQV